MGNEIKKYSIRRLSSEVMFKNFTDCCYEENECFLIDIANNNIKHLTCNSKRDIMELCWVRTFISEWLDNIVNSKCNKVSTKAIKVRYCSTCKEWHNSIRWAKNFKARCLITLNNDKADITIYVDEKISDEALKNLLRTIEGMDV